MEDRIKDFIKDLKNSIEKFERIPLTDDESKGKIAEKNVCLRIDSMKLELIILIYIGACASKTSPEKTLKDCIAEKENRVLVQVREDFRKNFKNDKEIAKKICASLATSTYNLYAKHILEIESHDKGLVLLFKGGTQMRNFFKSIKRKKEKNIKIYASNLYELDGEKDYEIEFFELTTCYDTTIKLREKFSSVL